MSKKPIKKVVETISQKPSIKAEKEKKSTSKSDYTSKQITVLEGLDPVRKRPGMYIGSTGQAGLHHLIYEVVDNAIDEAMAGFCNEVDITLLPDHQVEVRDNGRGIPVDLHKQYKKSALELVMTKLHAGGKFDQSSYKVSGGLHGVGISVVNALSAYTKAEVRREGKIYVQEYKRGKPIKKIRTIGKTNQTGTTITFQPDEEIFETLEFNWQTILDHLRQQAYLTKKVKISIFDKRDKKKPNSHIFYFEGGIASYVRHINHNKEVKHETVFYIEKEVKGTMVEIALQYTNEYNESIFTFANNIYNPEGGTHLVGFRTALTRTINNHARKQEILKEKDENLTGEDMREGLTTIISIKIKDPQFEGQTKAKLGNPEVRTIVESVFSEEFTSFLEQHPKEAEAIIGKCLLASQARIAARTARNTVLRKGAMEGLTLPGKLADCSSRKPEESELYIVEGDSAGGSAKQGRDREFQAILPMWGKMLNVEKSRLDKILNSDKLRPLVIAMGTNIGELFDLGKLRYHRVILMADADVDGAHIRTLLLTFFYRYFRPLIEHGHLYIAQPPLYRLQKGREVIYAYNDAEKEKIMEHFAKNSPKDTKKVSSKKITEEKSETEENNSETENEIESLNGINIQRYKGLGEMNPLQLWETTMNPKTRLMKQVIINDAEKVDETFDILMGSNVEPRKHFIQTHAKKVKNLDI